MIDKTVGGILRKSRAIALADACAMDEEVARLEGCVLELQRDAAAKRNLHCQLGAAIQLLEGEDAILDLPDRRAPFARPTADALTSI